MRIEPRYLERLPSRFRTRFRENTVVIVGVAAMLLLPSRVGANGYNLFFTIAFLTLYSCIAARVWAPRRATLPLASWLLAGNIVAYVFPLISGWITRELTGIDVVSIFIGNFLFIALVVVERKIILPQFFGDERFLGDDYEDVCEAQRAVHRET